MTQEEKQLLLKDLCARFPYDVYVHIRYKTGEPCYGKLTSIDIQWFIDSKIENIKPYLRPMSSMTEKEKSKLRQWGCLCMKPNDIVEDIDSYIVEDVGVYGAIHSIPVIDYLNSIHVDYRGLIPMGLALPAPEGMYEF